MKFVIVVLILSFLSYLEIFSQVTDEWILVDSSYMSTGFSGDFFISNYRSTNLLSNYSDKLFYYNLEQPGFFDKDFNRVNAKLFLRYSSDGGSTWNRVMERYIDCTQCYLFWYTLCTPSENKIVISEDSAEQFQYFEDGKKRNFFKRHARLLISDDRGSSYRFIYFDSNTVITDISMVDENRGTCFLRHLSNPFYENSLNKDEILYTNNGWITYKNINFNDSTLLFAPVHFLSDGKMIVQVNDTLNKRRFIYYSTNDGADWNSYEMKIDNKLTLKKIISENELFFIYSDSLQPTWIDYTKILRTKDGGNTFDTVWKKTNEFSFYFFESFDTNNFILCYYNNFPNDLNYYIIKTSNAGITWENQYYHTQTNDLFCYKPIKVLFINKNLLYVRTDGSGLTPGTNIFKYTGNKTLKPILPIITGEKNGQNLFKTDSVLVSWNKIEGATSYHIEVTGLSFSDFSDHQNLIEHIIHNAISTNVTDTSILLTNLNKYYYYTAIGKSQNSTMTSIDGESYFRTEQGNLNIPQIIYPDTSIKGYYNNDKILFKWSSVTNAESYDLAITYSNNKFYDNIPIVSVKGTNDTSYLFKGLLNYSKYGIFVRAVNDNEISDWKSKFIYTHIINNYIEEKNDIDASVIVYPNPISNSFYIEFTNLKIPMVNVEVYDILGIKIFTKYYENLDQSTNRITVDIRDEIKTGSYFLAIKSGNITFYKMINKID